MEYNSGRPKMIIPEYGRNIQKMVDHATAIKDKEERNRCAQAIITVMGQLNPHLRDVSDFKHKLWDHLFIMSNFKLDVDSPYDKPSIEILEEKPELMSYPNQRIRYRHYGKIVQDLVAKAIAHEEGKDKEDFVRALLNLMKRQYLNWNNNSVSDEIIKNDLIELSEAKLKIPEDFEFEATQEILSRNFQKKRRHGKQNGGHKNHRRGKKN